MLAHLRVIPETKREVDWAKMLIFKDFKYFFKGHVRRWDKKQLRVALFRTLKVSLIRLFEYVCILSKHPTATLCWVTHRWAIITCEKDVKVSASTPLILPKIICSTFHPQVELHRSRWRPRYQKSQSQNHLGRETTSRRSPSRVDGYAHSKWSGWVVVALRLLDAGVLGHWTRFLIKICTTDRGFERSQMLFQGSWSWRFGYGGPAPAGKLIVYIEQLIVFNNTVHNFTVFKPQTMYTSNIR